jgi:hypothetical protein
MNSNTKLFATILIVIGVGYGAYSVVNQLNIDIIPSRPATTKPPSTFTVTYLPFTNRTYNFSYEYPNTLDMQVIGTDEAILGIQGTLRFTPIVQILLIKGGTEITFQSFDEFVLDKVRAACSLTTTTVSITCNRIDDVVNIRPFTSANGVQGQVFYLKAEQKNLSTGKTDTVRRGPFYTFNSSQKTIGVKSFIMISNSASLSAEDADTATIESVAESLAY